MIFGRLFVPGAIRKCFLKQPMTRAGNDGRVHFDKFGSFGEKAQRVGGEGKVRIAFAPIGKASVCVAIAEEFCVSEMKVMLCARIKGRRREILGFLELQPEKAGVGG